MLWTEKYRPTTLSSIILPPRIADQLAPFVTKGEIPNLLFFGPAGSGKTTVAKALCKTLGFDYIFINGSDERNIDVLRNKIRNFASTVSFEPGKHKVVIIDEADYLNPTSTQPALRAFIEEFSDNCRFILTCNYVNKILEPVRSRLTLFDFNIGTAELPALQGAMAKRLFTILDDENITYEEKVVFEVIVKYAPDWRKIISECQRYSASGKIDSGIFIDVQEESYNELYRALREKDFKGMRKWVGENTSLDANVVYRKLFDNIKAYSQDVKRAPPVILTIAEYAYKHNFVVDPEINLVACCIEIMGVL